MKNPNTVIMKHLSTMSFLVAFSMFMLSCSTNDNEVLSNSWPADGNGLRLIYEKNWEGVQSFPYWFSAMEGGPSVEMVADGVALTNPILRDLVSTSQTIVSDYDKISLEGGRDYIVRLTMKVPSDGTYQVALGNWVTNVVSQATPRWRDDFQEIDFLLPTFIANADGSSSVNDGHVRFQFGWVVGTTIVKKVQVYEQTKR
jgi:hypothetical protein